MTKVKITIERELSEEQIAALLVPAAPAITPDVQAVPTTPPLPSETEAVPEPVAPSAV